jgi:hypothetical protein
MSEEIPAPHIRREITTHAAEHECFLAFNSDWHAVAFQDWLAEEGFKRFQEWASYRKGDYR